MAFLIAIYVMLSIITSTKGSMCGKPGKQLKTSYSPTKAYYNVNEEVNYKCDGDDGYLIGNSKRTCLNNGTWSEFVPLCNKNLAYKKTATVSELKSNCNSANLVDNNKNTFCDIESGTTLTVNISTTTKINVKYILLNLNAYREPHFKVHVNKIPCKTMQNYYYKNEKLLTMVCPNTILTTSVTITFDSEVKLYDISVNDHENDCQVPDVPFNGKFNNGRFSCNDGYSLRGNHIAHCVNRLWLPNNQYCESNKNVSNNWKGCGKAGKPSNGYWFIEGNVEDQITYACDKGYHMLGAAIRVCKNNKTWSSSIPKCVNNLATGKNTYLQPNVIYRGSSTDGFLQSCEYQDTHFYGSVDLNGPTFFNHFILNIKTQFPTDIYIYASNTSKINSLELICNYKDVLSKQPLPVLCNRPTIAKYVVMYYSNQVSICEITVFNDNEIPACGEPDYPINGKITANNSTFTIYECDDGFIFQGPQSIRCVNGNWESGPPLCMSNSTLTTFITSTTLIIISISVGVTSFFIAIIVGYYLIKKYCCNIHGDGNDKTPYPSLSIKEIGEQSTGESEDGSSELYEVVQEPNYLPQVYCKGETTPSEMESEYLDVRECNGTSEQEDLYENTAAIKNINSKAFPFKGIKNQAKKLPALPTIQRAFDNTYKY